MTEAPREEPPPLEVAIAPLPELPPPPRLPVIEVAQAPFARVPPAQASAVDATPPERSTARAPRLILERSTRNAITDDDAWYDALGGNPNPRELAPSEWDALLEAGLALPDEDLLRTARVINNADQRVFLFDVEGQDGRYVLVELQDGTFWGTYDFSAFRDPPVRTEYTEIGTQWAQRVGERLIVSHAYNGYAKESGGHNAYLSAIDREGRLLWRSEALVSNAMQCVVVRESHAICGYGFTAEPDYLSVIDLTTGEVTSRTKLKKGPRVLAWKDGQLWVRTYDHNLVFRVE